MSDSLGVDGKQKLDHLERIDALVLLAIFIKVPFDLHRTLVAAGDVQWQLPELVFEPRPSWKGLQQMLHDHPSIKLLVRTGNVQGQLADAVDLAEKLGELSGKRRDVMDGAMLADICREGLSLKIRRVTKPKLGGDSQVRGARGRRWLDCNMTERMTYEAYSAPSSS